MKSTLGKFFWATVGVVLGLSFGHKLNTLIECGAEWIVNKITPENKEQEQQPAAENKPEEENEHKEED